MPLVLPPAPPKSNERPHPARTILSQESIANPVGLIFGLEEPLPKVVDKLVVANKES